MVLPHIAFARLFTRALDFSGRSSRSEFWWGQLMLIFATIGAFIALSFFVSTAMSAAADGSPLTSGAAGLGLAGIVCGVTLINLSAQTRRLHDAGYSGWWMLLSIVPLIGGLVLLVLMVMPSDDQANRWGPPPGPPNRPLREPAAPLANAAAAPRPATKKSSAWDSYAILVNGDAPPPPHVVEARKAEVSDYYRRHILKKPDIAAE